MPTSNKAAQPQRYLLAKLPEHTAEDLESSLLWLRQLLAAASALGRTAVLEHLPLDPAIGPDRDPRAYRDLDNAIAYGDDLPVEGAKINYAMRPDLQPADFSPQDTLTLTPDSGGRYPAPEGHQQTPLIVLEPAPNLTQLDCSALAEGRRHHLAWTPSESVRQLAAQTISELMRISSGYPKTKRYFLHRQSGDDWKAELPGEYLCLHVHRGQLLREWPYALFTTNPKRIRKCLEQLPRFKTRSIIYLMASGDDPSRLAHLKKAYPNLWSYRDFPHLRALLEGDAPNRHLLAAVERQLFKRAGLQVSTKPMPDEWRTNYTVPPYWAIKITPPHLKARMVARALKRSIGIGRGDAA